MKNNKPMLKRVKSGAQKFFPYVAPYISPYVQKVLAPFLQRQTTNKGTQMVPYLNRTKSSGTNTGVRTTQSTHQSGNTRPGLTFTHGKRVKGMSTYQTAKIKKALAAMNIYELNTSTTTTNLLGQGNYTVFPLGSTADCSTIAGYVGTNLTTKFSIENMKKQLLVTNASTVSAYLRVYECTLRHDIPTSKSSFQTFIQSGWADAASSSAHVNYTDVSSTIFNNTQFVNYCKVDSVRIQEFGPGETMKIDLFENTPKNINKEILQNADTLGLRGVTRLLVLQQYGQPIADATNTLQISTALVKFNFVDNTKYTYQWISDTATSTNVTTAYGTINAGSIVNPQIGTVSQADSTN